MEGEKIISVKVQVSEAGKEKYSRICFILTNGFITIDIDTNSDELILNYTLDETESDDGYSIPAWNNFVCNKKIVLSWFPKNSLGYSDVIIFGLDAAIPNFIIYAIASDIEIHTFSK